MIRIREYDIHVFLLHFPHCAGDLIALLGRDVLIEFAPEQQHRSSQLIGSTEKRRDVAAVIGNRGLQRQRGVCQERRPASHAISDTRDVIAGIAIRLEPAIRRFDIIFQGGFFQRLQVRHRRREVIVTAFPLRRCGAMK